MEIALYVRVSTTRQHHTQTIEQQLARLRAAVATHPDWHLAEEHIYRDDGYSGAKLNRPGLDRLRDRAAFAAFERVVLTAPDRLARNYVHQILLIDELTQRGCQVEFLDRPMSEDPHDQLLLHIRGAVAEYERTLIAERMRRGRQAKLRSGQLLPWTMAPYGYLLDPERPRDPSRVRPDAVKAAVVSQSFASYATNNRSLRLYWCSKPLSDPQIPPPSRRARFNLASVRGILRNPAYAGTAYSGRTHPAPARHRKSALQPVGPGASQRPAPPNEGIAVPVPALISQETFAAAQSRLDRNAQFARRNNTAHDYLLRGLVSCGQCQLACMGRTLPTGYTYYTCRGRSDALRAAANHRCTARYAPAHALDTLVWQDLCRVLTEPALITHELARAQGGEWLPHALHARRQTLRKALAELERQQARLLEVYLAAIIGREEFERKHQEVTQTQQGLAQQLRQLELQAQQQVDVAALAQGIEAFCHRIRPTLDHLTFAQRRQLVTLLIDRVIVSDGQVEIRYVVPTGPQGETVPFCHLRLDYFNPEPPLVTATGQLTGRRRRDQIPGFGGRRRPVHGQMEAAASMLLGEGSMGPETALAGQHQGQPLKIRGASTADVVVGTQAQAHAPALAPGPLRQYTRAKLPIPQQAHVRSARQPLGHDGQQLLLLGKTRRPGPQHRPQQGQGPPAPPHTDIQDVKGSPLSAVDGQMNPGAAGGQPRQDAPRQRRIVEFNGHVGVLQEPLHALLERVAGAGQGQGRQDLAHLQALAAQDAQRYCGQIHQAGERFQRQIVVQGSNQVGKHFVLWFDH